MEYSDYELSTPRFGNYEDSKNLNEELLGKVIRKSSSSSTKNCENEEKYNNKKDKIKIKAKEKSKNKSKEKRKSKSDRKSKNKSKEKNENKFKVSKEKDKYNSGIYISNNEKTGNPFDDFLKKKIKLRNDFDQINSEKLILEKELAFQQFEIDENADYLDD